MAKYFSLAAGELRRFAEKAMFMRHHREQPALPTDVCSADKAG
jgi:hypothetical protein